MRIGSQLTGMINSLQTETPTSPNKGKSEKLHKRGIMYTKKLILSIRSRYVAKLDVMLDQDL
jgi:hypothetical protein